MLVVIFFLFPLLELVCCASALLFPAVSCSRSERWPGCELGIPRYDQQRLRAGQGWAAPGSALRLRGATSGARLGRIQPCGSGEPPPLLGWAESCGPEEPPLVLGWTGLNPAAPRSHLWCWAELGSALRLRGAISRAGLG